jgi:hypothetical protein
MLVYHTVLIADLAKAQGSVSPDHEFTVDTAQAEFWFSQTVL